MIIKTKATRNVSLKISFSRPRLLKDVPPPKLPDLPKPVPLAWIKIRTTRIIDETIWAIVKNCFMHAIIPQRSLEDPIPDRSYY